MAPYLTMDKVNEEDRIDQDKRDFSSIISFIGGNDSAKAKKRRRGDAEKKRRDRINRCLDQLEELIPYVKQKKLCSKVDKAEVLELTVQYIKETLIQRDVSIRPTRLSMLDYEHVKWRTGGQTKSNYNHSKWEDHLTFLNKISDKEDLCRCGCGRTLQKPMQQSPRLSSPSRLILSPTRKLALSRELTVSPELPSSRISPSSRDLQPSRELSPFTSSSTYSYSSSSPRHSPHSPSPPTMTPSPITHNIEYLLLQK